MNSLKQAAGHRGTTARRFGFLGLAVLGLALAAPVEAAPEHFFDGVFLAARDRSDTRGRGERRDPRADEYYPERRDQRANERGAEREEPRGYGYGYERRQQRRHEPDDRSRGRH